MALAVMSLLSKATKLSVVIEILPPSVLFASVLIKACLLPFCSKRLFVLRVILPPSPSTVLAVSVPLLRSIVWAFISKLPAAPSPVAPTLTSAPSFTIKKSVKILRSPASPVVSVRVNKLLLTSSPAIIFEPTTSIELALIVKLPPSPGRSLLEFSAKREAAPTKPPSFTISLSTFRIALPLSPAPELLADILAPSSTVRELVVIFNSPTLPVFSDWVETEIPLLLSVPNVEEVPVSSIESTASILTFPAFPVLKVTADICAPSLSTKLLVSMSIVPPSPVASLSTVADIPLEIVS